VRAAANGIRYTLLACFLATVIPRSHLSRGSGTREPLTRRKRTGRARRSELVRAHGFRPLAPTELI